MNTIPRIRRIAGSSGVSRRLALLVLVAFGALMKDGYLAPALAQAGHRSRGAARFTEHKGRNKQAKTHNMTIPPELQQAIDAYDATAEGKVRHVSGIYLLTEAGIPFSTKGFSNRWRKWCDDAGVPQCTSHSLRKWGATTMAERGATDWQMAAFLGHTNTKQAANYTKKANRDRLTAVAIPLLGTRAAAE